MRASKNELPIMLQAGSATIRGADWGELRAALVSVPAGTDFGPLLKGLPGRSVPGAPLGLRAHGPPAHPLRPRRGGAAAGRRLLLHAARAHRRGGGGHRVPRDRAARGAPGLPGQRPPQPGRGLAQRTQWPMSAAATFLAVRDDQGQALEENLDSLSRQKSHARGHDWRRPANRGARCPLATTARTVSATVSSSGRAA